MNHPLKVRDLLRCPHCRRWHPVVKWHSEGTAYTLRMLYFDCHGNRYYVGQENLESRHETKATSGIGVDLAMLRPLTQPRW